METDNQQSNQDQEQQLNKQIHESVVDFLHKLEQQKQFKIIFVAETGSRGQGFATKESDCDIKGFYTYSQDESYLCEKHIIKLNDTNEIDIDLSLIEFRHYIEERLNQQHEKMNIIFTSNVQYINLFDKEMFNQFVYHTLQTPMKAFQSDLDTFITRRIQKEDVECRKILNTLQCLLTLIHFSSSQSLYQYSYNLWEEIELNPYLDGRTKKNILEFAQICFDKKNYSRKATIKRKNLPSWFMNMIDLYNSQRNENLVVYENQEFKILSQKLHLYFMSLQ